MSKFRYHPERKAVFGADLVSAHIVVGLGGKVKVVGDEHVYSKDTIKEKRLPRQKTDGFLIEAADLTETKILYEGLENFCKSTLLKMPIRNDGKVIHSPLEDFMRAK